MTHLTGRQRYGDVVLCKGDWSLGTACGRCLRCIETRPIGAVRPPAPVPVDNLLEPGRELNQPERMGWRSFFGGRSIRSMQGYEETKGWWLAHGHAYALGWASTMNSADCPQAIRDLGGVPFAAWIDGRQRHQALTAQADMVRSAVR